MAKLSILQLRKEIADHIKSLAPSDQKLDPSQWWYCGLDTMRLTMRGFNTFQDYFDSYEFNIDLGEDEVFSARLLVKINQKIQSPYFLDPSGRKITIFSSQEATAITMYGSFTKYLSVMS